MDLHSENINEIATSLCKAQSEIQNVSKDKQAYGYKYADLASCLEALREPFAKNGLSVTQLIQSHENGKQMLVTMLMHSSGQWIKSYFDLENVPMKSCNNLQQQGAGLTYARRYCLSAIAGLTQEDDDAQSIPKQSSSKQSIQKDEDWYSWDDFSKNKSAWSQAISDGKLTNVAVIERIELSGKKIAGKMRDQIMSL
ncbi:ERF family protein [Francisella marina]|uniref:ERF family protein n=1 Tax=Francisella marina TaxID=2249302 RepID=A0ABX5ZHA9_9GAMM|nr:ERF family protein [Francisella marina]QEO57595.1 hypothetical protein F0R74_06910 [Francisella marina]QEO58290.1 hypothetical protein F0R75_00330 [Francisella marina]